MVFQWGRAIRSGWQSGFLGLGDEKGIAGPRGPIDSSVRTWALKRIGWGGFDEVGVTIVIGVITRHGEKMVQGKEGHQVRIGIGTGGGGCARGGFLGGRCHGDEPWFLIPDVIMHIQELEELLGFPIKEHPFANDLGEILFFIG